MKTPLAVALIVASVSCLLAAPARAVLVNGLYEARVPVTDQSAAQRSGALQQAFNLVLVKITGNRAASNSLAASLGNPSRFIQQYRYEQAPADPANPAVLPGLILWAKFDSGVVEKALRAAHAPLWGAERPRTLLWLALPENGGHLLNATDSSPLMQALLTAAEQRGIVLVFPQMDATDKSAIAVADIASMNDDRIRQASLRYHADAVLVGQLTPAQTFVSAHWQWLAPDQAQDWQAPVGDEFVVAVDGVQVAADRFAQRYAVSSDAVDQDQVPLEVDGITSLDAYAKVLAYLGALTPVRAVSVQRVAGGSVFYNLDIHGSVENLQSALSLGGLLSAVAVASPTPGTVATDIPATSLAPLRYSYNP